MENEIILDSKEKYRLLLNIKTDDKEYVIYTKDEVNEYNDIICYGAEYKVKKGRQVLIPIKDEATLEVIDNIFMQVENLLKKESKEKNEK